jgi:hypothetical protein
LVAQGCGHGDGDDDLSGVMPERSEDLERVSASQCPPASASLHNGDGGDNGDGSDEGSEHQHCGGGQGYARDFAGHRMLWTAQPEAMPATLPFEHSWHPWRHFV